MEVIVSSRGSSEAALNWGSGERRAAVGKSGIGNKISEGDGITPAGSFAFRRVLYRGDRLARPATKLPALAIARDDGWCDAPLDPAYNRPVKLPYRSSAEALWRDDHLYDLLVVVGFNDAPVVPGAGSAIFLHVARPDYGSTNGCVAIAIDDLRQLVRVLAPGDRISIRA